MQQRMRKFRVKRPAVGAVSEPNFETYESRDYCMFSPNVLFRCAPPDGAPGRGVSYSDTGGIRRCETSFTIPPTPPDVQLKRSGMYNHRFLAEASGEVYETHSSEWKWRRPPHPWERDEPTPPLHRLLHHEFYTTTFALQRMRFFACVKLYGSFPHFGLVFGDNHRAQPYC